MVPSQFGSEGAITALLKDLVTESPPGLVGSTVATPRCLGYLAAEELCSGDSQVGMITVEYFEEGSISTRTPAGLQRAAAGRDLEPLLKHRPLRQQRCPHPHRPGLRLDQRQLQLHRRSANRRRHRDPLGRPGRPPARPAAPLSRNRHRLPLQIGTGAAAARPTSCGEPLTWTTVADTWALPGFFLNAQSTGPAMTGCQLVPFNPSLIAQPTTTTADSPSGLELNIHLPQTKDPEKISTADLRNTFIAPAEGLVINPAVAGGLVGCSPAQIDLHGAGPAHCPDTSKVGSAEINTPQLDHPLHGSIYVATPRENPFGSLFAIYIAVRIPNRRRDQARRRNQHRAPQRHADRPLRREPRSCRWKTSSSTSTAGPGRCCGRRSDAAPTRPSRR